MSHFMGLDVSTTATKALIMDGDGQIVAVGSSRYGFSSPRPRWTEQDPGLWWGAAIEAIGEALARAGLSGSQISGVGLTGQMHGMVLLDGDLEVLRPAILWNDQRTESQTKTIETLVGQDRLIQITGNPALTGFTAPKLLWTREHEPAVWRAAEHLLLPKDYVRLKLSDTLATDPADASGTSLLDLSNRAWSPSLTETLGIPMSMLPGIVEGPEIAARVSARGSEDTGIPEGTPIVAGGGDQAANGVGVGAISEGRVAVSLGTSGVVFTATGSPLPEPKGRLHAFCHAVADTWHLMGVMLSAAGSYRWLRDTVAPQSSFSELDQTAESAPAGSAGLTFLPYLTGERTPHADPRARGAFVGLTVRHGVGHLARAVLEGVAFGLRDSLELMHSLVEIGEVRISGGGSSSTLWTRIIADVFDRPVERVSSVETAAHGAALLASAGVGAFATIEEACGTSVAVTGAVEPGRDREVYDEAYGIYRDLYPALRRQLHQLTDIDA